MRCSRALAVHIALLAAACLLPGVPGDQGGQDAAAAAAEEDDECQEEGCTLSALQLRAKQQHRGSDGSAAAAAAGHRKAFAHLREIMEAEQDPEQKFALFREAYQREYNGSEVDARYEQFASNLRKIEQLNRKNGAKAFGLSTFTDLFPHELPKMGFTITRPPGDYHIPVVGESAGLSASARLGSDVEASGLDTKLLPESFNWALTRVVTPVKNQGTCGACWAFVAAEEVESIHNLWGSGVYSAYGVEQTFSVQQLISCAPKPALGCGGGNPLDAYDYLAAEPSGLIQESLWPYEQGITPEDDCEDANCTQPCRTRLLDKGLRKITGPAAVVLGYRWAVPPCDAPTEASSDAAGSCMNQDLDLLTRNLVMYGPIGVAVNGEHWGLYTDGVMTFEACGRTSLLDMNHAAQLVGYDKRGKEPFWLLRNQWGTSWGALQPDSGIPTGYIKLEYGKNTCGLANWATIPTVPGFDEEGPAELPGDPPGPTEGPTESAGAGADIVERRRSGGHPVFLQGGRRLHRPERFRHFFKQAAGEAWAASMAL